MLLLVEICLLNKWFLKTIKSLRNHRKMMDSFNADATILSIDLNQDEDEVIIEEELPGYTWYFDFYHQSCHHNRSPPFSSPFLFSYQYLSDIGGTAGLVLGLSIASLFEYFELFYYMHRTKFSTKFRKISKMGSFMCKRNSHNILD